MRGTSVAAGAGLLLNKRLAVTGQSCAVRNQRLKMTPPSGQPFEQAVDQLLAPRNFTVSFPTPGEWKVVLLADISEAAGAITTITSAVLTITVT